MFHSLLAAADTVLAVPRTTKTNNAIFPHEHSLTSFSDTSSTSPSSADSVAAATHNVNTSTTFSSPSTSSHTIEPLSLTATIPQNATSPSNPTTSFDNAGPHKLSPPTTVSPSTPHESLSKDSKVVSKVVSTPPTSFDESGDAPPADVFENGQKLIDQANESMTHLIKELGHAHSKIRVAYKAREKVWENLVSDKETLTPLGVSINKGLKGSCMDLAGVLREADEGHAACASAQEMWTKLGKSDNKLSLEGCADQTITNDLKSKPCERRDDKLLCTWLEEKVLPTLGYQKYFEEPEGLCVVSEDTEFNMPPSPEAASLLEKEQASWF